MRLVDKQIENVWDRFSRDLAQALLVLDQGLCKDGTKERFRVLLQERAEHIGL
ncbi:MAG: hypothetical protein HON70_42490 [Lentisphaerae bacterium]|nr:hypothetical protein [Lentisphaerota bacterium]